MLIITQKLERMDRLLHCGHEMLGKRSKGEDFGETDGERRQAKQRADKNDWEEFSKVIPRGGRCAARTAACNTLFNNALSREQALTAAFVMISPFSYGDPPLCMSLRPRRNVPAC